MKLHNYFRSSTSTRLRAALNLKGLDADYLGYDLRDGATRSPEYLALNPAGLVPSLELDDGTVLVQSIAIIEWLDEAHPTPTLLPETANARARVRALANMIACEVHPLNNLRVLTYLKTTFGADDTAIAQWFTHWVNTTFSAFETTLAGSAQTGLYCHGDTPTLADICLYAQVWNNRRFNVNLSPYPTISRVFTALDALPAFQKAAPPSQPDAD
ncbi:MAG: maleylacetoacetate isomerase [Rhodobacteraceae bacterium]|nr:maleylacetoacetate isomerase [Paracoccaceae bacterium]PHR53571.1 MAG: maleylacetoacetate isomerase [Robiginitomaculum sp.]